MFEFKTKPKVTGPPIADSWLTLIRPALGMFAVSVWLTGSLIWLATRILAQTSFAAVAAPGMPALADLSNMADSRVVRSPQTYVISGPALTEHANIRLQTVPVRDLPDGWHAYLFIATDPQVPAKRLSGIGIRSM